MSFGEIVNTIYAYVSTAIRSAVLLVFVYVSVFREMKSRLGGLTYTLHGKIQRRTSALVIKYVRAVLPS